MPRPHPSSSQRTPHTAARALTAACLMVVGCTGAEPTEVDTDEVSADALLYANAFASEMVPFAVAIETPKVDGRTRSSCTASRVGERLLLTAAHCVYLTEPSHVFVQSESGLEEERFELEERIVFPSGAACWAKASTREARTACVYDFPDVALLRTTKALPARFAIAPVDARPVEPGESITQVGAGAASGENGQRLLDGRLRLGPSYVARFSWLYPVQRTEAGVQRTLPRQSETLAFFAPGRNFGRRILVQTAPGDSGGPVVRKMNGKLSVVGVHSTSGTAAQYSSEARVDDASGVAAWLHANGVAPHRSVRPTRRSCAPDATADAALGFCVRDDDGVAYTAVLATSLRPTCEADRALPSDKQPVGLSRLASCAQRGIPTTLLHHWVFGL